MSKSLEGQTALVTGAGRGFGRAIAQRLAADGAAVALVARSKTQLDHVAEAIKAAGGKAFVVVSDVTDPEDVAAGVSEVRDRLGVVTLLVNNAGVAEPYGPIGVVDPEAWWRAHAVHVRGPLLFMSAVMPGMIEQGGGRIVNVASLGGFQVTPHMSAYGVGKAAEIRLTEHVAAEGRAHGVYAFSIEPGTVHTNLAEGTINSSDARKWIPGGVAFLARLKAENPDPKPGLDRCASLVARLLSGRYDALSGRYIDAEDDLDEVLREAEAGLPQRGPRRIDV